MTQLKQKLILPSLLLGLTDISPFLNNSKTYKEIKKEKDKFDIARIKRAESKRKMKAKKRLG